MKILLYSNLNKDKEFFNTKEIAKYLLSKKVEIIISKEMEGYFDELEVSLFDKTTAENIDLLIVLGGDGTFLSASHKYY